MIKMLMQDGNTIYTDIDDLSVLIHYDAILPKLASTNACLGMESTESAQTIFTMACDYMEQTSEERAMDRTIPKTAVGVWSMEEAKSYAEQQEELARQQAEAEAAQKAYEEEQEQKKKEEAAMQAVKEANPQTEEEAQQEEAEQSALQQQIEEANSAQDWAQSQYSWLEYSESTGLYRSVYTQELFAYDESAGGFVSIQ
jgi:chemotaxis protein histidine kinase CheA